jgi:hypothetical protein
MARLSPEQVAAWLADSCARQDVPVAVTDPRTLARIGVLLGGTGGAAPEGGAAPRPHLQPPDRLDAVGVEPARSRQCVGVDDRVVENRGDNRPLPVEVEADPLVA